MCFCPKDWIKIIKIKIKNRLECKINMTGYKYGKQNQEYQILSVSMVVTALQKKK